MYILRKIIFIVIKTAIDITNLRRKLILSLIIIQLIKDKKGLSSQFSEHFLGVAGSIKVYSISKHSPNFGPKKLFFLSKLITLQSGAKETKLLP